MTKKPLLETTQALSERFFIAANKQEKEGNQVLCEVYRRCQVFLDELSSIKGIEDIVAAYAIEESSIAELVIPANTNKQPANDNLDAMYTLYNIHDSLSLLAESDFGIGDARTMQLILAFIRTVMEPMKNALDEISSN